MITSIVARHDLGPVRLAAIYSEQTVDSIRDRLRNGPVLHGLGYREDADVFGAQQYPPLFDLEIP